MDHVDCNNPAGAGCCLYGIPICSFAESIVNKLITTFCSWGTTLLCYPNDNDASDNDVTSRLRKKLFKTLQNTFLPDK